MSILARAAILAVLHSLGLGLYVLAFAGLLFWITSDAHEAKGN